MTNAQVVLMTKSLKKYIFKLSLGSVKQFKITFVIAHRIPDPLLRIVESEKIVIRLYSLATNPNTDKPIDIQSRLNINE